MPSAMPSPKSLVRKLTPAERPQKSRAADIDAVRLRLATEAAAVQARAVELEAATQAHNERVEARYRRELGGFARAAKATRQILPAVDRLLAEARRHEARRDAHTAAYYERFRALRGTARDLTPDIDAISQTKLAPSRCVTIQGSGFGPAQGKVLLEVAPNRVVELLVDSWDDGQVTAQVDPIVGDVPLRPHYGRIWLSTGAGLTSNAWNIQYEPLQAVYLAQWTRWVSGGLFGASESGTFLEGELLGDQDFSILSVECNHSGSGWSELRRPTAGGQCMEQGWHVGVRATKHAKMTLVYKVIGPKNITPREFEKLGPWSYLGDA